MFANDSHREPTDIKFLSDRRPVPPVIRFPLSMMHPPKWQEPSRIKRTKRFSNFSRIEDIGSVLGTINQREGEKMREKTDVSPLTGDGEIPKLSFAAAKNSDHDEARKRILTNSGWRISKPAPRKWYKISYSAPSSHLQRLRKHAEAIPMRKSGDNFRQ